MTVVQPHGKMAYNSLLSVTKTQLVLTPNASSVKHTTLSNAPGK